MKYIKLIFLIAVLFSSSSINAQQLGTVTLSPQPFTDCTNASVVVNGSQLATNYIMSPGTFTINGNNIDIVIDFNDSGIGIPILTPFTQTIQLGNLPSGNYTLNVTTYLNTVFNDNYSQSNVAVIPCCAIIASINESNTTLCSTNSSYTLTHNTPNATTYDWSVNGVSVSTAQSYTFNQTNTGIFNVKLTASDGNCSSSDSISIQVDAPPLFNLGADLTPCIGNNPTLNATVTQNNATYLWSTGATSATLSPSVSGTYWVEVSVGACMNSDTIDVSFLNGANINLGEDIGLCSNDSITINAGSYAGATYSWSTGSSDSIITVTSTGNYSVSVTSASGCVSSDNVNVVPIAPFGLSLPDTSVFCFGDSVLIEPLNSSPFATYLWSNGSTNSTLTASSDGFFSVDVTFNNGCTESASTQVVSFPEIMLGFSDTAVAFDINSPITLNAPSGYISYLWSTGETTASITITDIGTYSVTVTDSNGCLGNDDITYEFPSNTFDIINSNIAVAPNPTSNNLHIIGLDDFNDISITIVNNLGQVVLQENLKNKSIETERLPIGLYHLTILKENNVIQRIQFIKQ